MRVTIEVKQRIQLGKYDSCNRAFLPVEQGDAVEVTLHDSVPSVG